MKYSIPKLFCIAVFFFFTGRAQDITLERIFSGYYQTPLQYEIKPMKDGKHYAVSQGEKIALYSYENAEAEGYITTGNIISYSFSDDEEKILLLTEATPLYRHSFFGKFKVKYLNTGKSLSLNEGKYIQEPIFSPDNTKVSFIYENDLFYQDINSGKITRITFDGKKNEIINGLSDWVYEEEFGHSRQYEWDKSSEMILFIKTDEKKVPEMEIPMYEGNLYPKTFRYKYPKAGETNSTVKAFLYELKTKKTLPIDLKNFRNHYIPKIFSTAKAYEMVIITSERIQNAVDVIKISSKPTDSKKRFVSVEKLFTEESKTWIDTDDLTLDFLDDNSFFMISERDGYRHIYKHNVQGKLEKQLTKGKWDVTKYYGCDKNTGKIFVQTTEKGSTKRVISKVDITSGNSMLISPEYGNNSAVFGKNFDYFIIKHSSADEPWSYSLNHTDGRTIKSLSNNSRLIEILKKDNFTTREFFTIKNDLGQEMNAFIIKPKNFDPSKKYPLFMYQYSGPGSQQVSDSWDTFNGIWFAMLAQKGYIVACVDGRGTGYKGAEFKNSTYLKLGEYETSDQISAAKWFSSQPYIDKDRIGIFGWSFGGYIASLAMTKGSDVFKVGIAVAPVTNWKYYDSVYTERFLRTPEENPSGYANNSPTNFAHLLKGKFLLVHGTADENVHFQNSAEFSKALIQYEKQFEFMVYPDKNHGLLGGKTRKNLYEKMTNFILNNL